MSDESLPSEDELQRRRIDADLRTLGYQITKERDFMFAQLGWRSHDYASAVLIERMINACLDLRQKDEPLDRAGEAHNQAIEACVRRMRALLTENERAQSPYVPRAATKAEPLIT